VREIQTYKTIQCMHNSIYYRCMGYQKFTAVTSFRVIQQRTHQNAENSI